MATHKPTVKPNIYRMFHDRTN